MATQRDNNFRDLAERLLSTQKSMTYVSISLASSVNPTTLELDKTETSQVINARISKFDQSSIDGKNIQRDDLKVLVAAKVLISSIKPNADKIIIDGVEYSVVNFNDTYADEEKVLREIQVRK